jgi:RNA polymerase II C-terminal domain phosphatase-like 3/4
MSLAADSPVNSSGSSDDFAAFLDTELDSASDTSPQDDNDESDSDDDGDQDDGDDHDYEDDENYESNHERIKRRKVEIVENLVEVQVIENISDSPLIASHEEPGTSSDTSPKSDVCTHPGVMGGMCIRCGEKVDDQTGVAFGYIHKDLRLANEEIARLRDKDLKSLYRHKKLYLVLDLDHTLLNSTRFMDILPEEKYLSCRAESVQGVDATRGSLFRLDAMHMMTKLRPYVHTFLKEASSLFEMYIYTMGERAYAMQMAKLLDPENVYFNLKVIAQGDCTQRHQKGLDVVLGQESAVIILDDTEPVWVKHKENLILMERYHFFASSCKQFGFNCQSLSQLQNDENEAEGSLATVLQVLKRIHTMFYDPVLGDNLADRDVRQILKSVRKEVLRGCKIVFSRVFPTKYQAENHQLWKMAELLGAKCATEMDESVTHVVSTDLTTEKSRLALKEKKYVVHPRWIEACNYFWHKHPEENFPVSQPKNCKSQNDGIDPPCLPPVPRFSDQKKVVS